MCTYLPIKTDRLILRRFNESDINAFYKIFSDPKVNIFLPMFPLKNVEEAKEYLHKDYLNSSGYHYAVCLKTDNIPIGYINVKESDSYDFGYGLSKKYWHQGITTEAGKAVIEQLKSDGIPYITATHDVNNPWSGAVMKNLGMVYQYSYEEQWQPKDILVTFRMYQLNLDGDQNRVYKEYWKKYPAHYIEGIE